LALFGGVNSPLLGYLTMLFRALFFPVLFALGVCAL
jgi:hypothetical protein